MKSVLSKIAHVTGIVVLSVLAIFQLIGATLGFFAYLNTQELASKVNWLHEAIGQIGQFLSTH